MFVRYVIALCVYDMRAVRARDGRTVVDAARVLFEHKNPRYGLSMHVLHLYD